MNAIHRLFKRRVGLTHMCDRRHGIPSFLAFSAKIMGNRPFPAINPIDSPGETGPTGEEGPFEERESNVN